MDWYRMNTLLPIVPYGIATGHVLSFRNLEVGQQFRVYQETVGLCGNGFKETRRAGLEKIGG